MNRTSQGAIVLSVATALLVCAASTHVLPSPGGARAIVPRLQAVAVARSVPRTAARTRARGAHGGAARASQRSWFQHVTRAIAQREYEVSRADGSLQAPNRAQDLRVRFDDGAIRLEPRRSPGAWALSWRTERWGRTGAMAACATAAARPEGARVVFARPDLLEWYRNSPRGLEQGFRIARRPRGRGPVHIAGEMVESAPNPAASRRILAPRSAREGLVWDLPRAGGSARSVRYDGLVATDASGRTLGTRIEARGRQVDLVIDDAHAVYPVTVDPLFSATAYDFLRGAGTSERFGAAVSTAGDVNGDGFSDLVVGAPDYDNGHPGDGAVFLFAGSDTGLDVTPVWQFASDQTGAHLGAAVAPAGDVDGDGKQDFVVGAPDHSAGFTHEGRAYLFRGTAAFPSSTPAWTYDGGQANAHLGAALAGAGDVDGDHLRDIAVAAPDYDSLLVDRGRVLVFRGSAGGLSPNPAWKVTGADGGAHFGAALAGTGDLDGDGFSDLVVGAPDRNGATGAVFAYRGTAAGLSPAPAVTRTGTNPGDRFGASVAMAGSVDGDRYCDLVVGSPRASVFVPSGGRADLYRGGAGTLSVSPAWTAAGDQDSAFFGQCVATAGDVDGDGYADVIVGAPGEDDQFVYDQGQVYLYRGSRTGLGSQPAEIQSGLSPTSAGGDQFGAVAGTAGDLNDDGFSDVFVAAPYADFIDCEFCSNVDEGYVEVFYGRADGPASTAQRTVEGNQVNAQLGFAVASAGDVNGDGRSDVLVGAPLYDAGQIDEGRAFLYLGTDSGLASTPAWIGESNQAGAHFGAAVASAGDVDADGYTDFAVGAPRYDAGFSDNGAAFVFRGDSSAAALSTTASWSAFGSRDSAQFGAALAGAGDLNGDGYADLAVGAPGYTLSAPAQGAFFVYTGSDSGLADIVGAEDTGPAAGFGLGTALATAGDVNGDALSELLVGTAGAGARIYYGRPSAAHPLDSLVVWSVPNPQPGSGFGRAVASAGDIDGDTFSDVLIGAPDFAGASGAEAGRVFLYRGASGGPSTTPARFLEIPDAGARFGTAVSAAGDLDADGYPDIVVGAPTDNPGRAGATGSVYAYSGAGGVLSAAPTWTVSGSISGAQFGASVAGRLDVNGDGFGDVVAGAPGYANGQAGEGAAFVYLGNGGPGAPQRPRLLRPGGGLSAKSPGRQTESVNLSLAGRFATSSGTEWGGGVGGGCPAKFPCWTCTGQYCSGGTTGTKATTTTNDSTIMAFPTNPGAGSIWFYRMECASPYFPHSRWLTSPYVSRTEVSYRYPGPMVDAVPDGPPLPAGVRLRAAPSPFLGGTRLTFDLPRAGRVRVEIFDAAGRRVAVLLDGPQDAGTTAVGWNGRRDDGRRTGPGVYFARIAFEDRTATARLVRLGR